MEASAGTPFAALAHAFLPADSDRRGLVVEADLDRPFASARVPDDVDVVIWGRLAGRSGPALRQAAAREVGLRLLRAALPEPLRVIAVHRLRAHRRDASARSRARAVLRGGVLVEIASPHAGPRVLDAVARAAGAHELGEIHAGVGGTVLVPARLSSGAAAIVRVACAGGPGDPSRMAPTLEALATAGVGPVVPRLLASGVTAGASWTAERALPGSRPPGLTPELVQDAVATCARLPMTDGPPTAPVDDLRAAATLLPERAAALEALAASLAPALAGLPGVLRHGDLWIGNLLWSHGVLSGIVDWDAAHPAGVPGADLVQLIAGDERRSARRGRRDLGAAVAARPWRSSAFAAATADYWRAIGVTPDPQTLDAAGIGWWACEVHHTLVRLPHRAADERWVAANVDAALAALTR